MSSHDMNETPLELREIEARLLVLKPSGDAELVRSMDIYVSTYREDLPRFAGPSSARSFTRFVRRAQYRVGLLGLLVGTLFGAVLGGLCVYSAMDTPQFRRCSHTMLGQVAEISPLYTITLDTDTKMTMPTSIKRILRYYDSITEAIDQIQAG